MRNFLCEKPLMLATHNQGKLREIAALFAPYNIEIISAQDAGVPEPVEDGQDFCENALIKARNGAAHSGLVSLADDSGLCVCALGDAPGIFSARWAGAEKDFCLAMDRVLKKLEGKQDRLARFVCALAIARPDGESLCVQGILEGKIAHKAKGEKGFGYDPIFIPNGHNLTMAQMDPCDKAAISHRAKAWEKLKKVLFAD